MSEPPRRQDPLALIVLGAGVLLIVGLGAYLVFSIRSQPETRAPGGSLREEIRDGARKLVQKLQQSTVPAPAPAPAPAPLPSPAKSEPASQKKAASKEVPQRAYARLEPGRTWRYAVKVEPESWKDIVLAYRTQKEPGGVGVQTDFTHAGGKSAFHLGIFEPGHATHPNTRFPGFFFYAAYLPAQLEQNQRVAFLWRWQGGSGSTQRFKQFEGRVTGWEDVMTKAGVLNAARIEGRLFYVDDGKVHAQARETFWYAPKVSQVVRIVREGRTPDEGFERITAELVEQR